jgi:hypothetical protein
MDCARLTTILIKQTVKQAECVSTGHRKEKRQKRARLISQLRLLVPSLSRYYPVNPVNPVYFFSVFSVALPAIAHAQAWQAGLW